MKIIFLLLKVVLLPYLIVFWTMKWVLSLPDARKGSKNKRIDSDAAGSTAGVVALLLAGLAARKAYGLSPQPVVSTKTPDKIQIHAVTPKGNHWIVHFSYWYSDAVKWSKSERKISRGTRGISAGAYMIDVDWH